LKVLPLLLLLVLLVLLVLLLLQIIALHRSTQIPILSSHQEHQRETKHHQQL
jgi:hypothetical protein